MYYGTMSQVVRLGTQSSLGMVRSYGILYICADTRLCYVTVGAFSVLNCFNLCKLTPILTSYTVGPTSSSLPINNSFMDAAKAVAAVGISTMQSMVRIAKAKGDTASSEDEQNMASSSSMVRCDLNHVHQTKSASIDDVRDSVVFGCKSQLW